jgi:HEAT repeat protein
MGDAAHRAVPTIVEVIKRYPDRTCRAIEIFTYLGRPSEMEDIALPFLRDLLRTSTPDIQEAILGAMAYIGTYDDAEQVFDYLNSPYLPVRLKAIWLLGVPGNHYTRALQTVEELLNNPNERVRAEAKRAMRNLQEGFLLDRPLD